MTTSLQALEVLALDCQATAPSPEKGHLLEIGWGRVLPSVPSPEVESHLLRLPEGAALPKRVARVTGLSESELADGDAPETVWSSVIDTARSIESGRCPTVIHFARYEEPFLRWLHEDADGDFPLRIVCTHEIVRRLLPDLPRRGLRAVAGYFGHPVSEMRRASHHVAATATVWRFVVDLLEAEGVHTLDELERWLRTSKKNPKSGRSYPMSPTARRHLPDRPGVYHMLDANGDILYVGKATSIKKRVSSYFRKSSRHAEHILEMLTQARDLSFTITGTALEAALEESDAIKEHEPPYNKALRARDRTLVFATRDLKHFAESPDVEHRIGPLPGGELWGAMSLLRGNDVPPDVLLVPGAYAPQEATFCEGLALFRQTLGTSSLLARGASLWHEEEPEEEFQLQMQYDVGVDRWSPQRVAARLDEIVTRASHLVRRAHWLCLLAESTLSWNGGTLTLANGRVCSSPASTEVAFRERRGHFDVATYDRLTVLTAEIRRLLQEETPVSLCIGSHTTLDEEKLKWMLRWI